MKPVLDVTYKLYLNPVHGVQSEYLHVVKSKEKIRNIPIRMLPYLIFMLCLIYGTALATVWDPNWQKTAHYFNFYGLSIIIFLAEILWVHRSFDGIPRILDSTVFINQKLRGEFQL